MQKETCILCLKHLNLLSNYLSGIQIRFNKKILSEFYNLPRQSYNTKKLQKCTLFKIIISAIKCSCLHLLSTQFYFKCKFILDLCKNNLLKVLVQFQIPSARNWPLLTVQTNPQRSKKYQVI